MTIKYKIALSFTAVTTLLISIVSISIYFIIVKETKESFEARLSDHAFNTAHLLKTISGNDFTDLNSIDKSENTSLYSKSILVLNNQDSVVYKYFDKDSEPLSLSTEERIKIRDKGTHYFNSKEKRVLGLVHNEGMNKYIIVVAAKDLEGATYLKILKQILWIAFFVTIIISGVIGMIFSRGLVVPLKRLTGELNLITSTNLSQRINTDGFSNEFNNLSQTLNNLLDRLNESFAIQRRFISNASHELSTPLTSISSQLEVTMQKERTPEEYREVMTSIFEDISELQLLTKSLLDIAKAGSHGSIDLSEIRLDEILIKVASDIQKQNKNFKTKLNFEELPDDDQYLTVFGNPDLLYIALKNIIENGCKYSDNQQSNVGILITERDVIIHVVNKGDVIAEADIQNIFQPFFRTNSALGKPGFGLGLTLTRRILSLHNGSITVESSIEKGTIFTIKLPNILTTA